MGRKRLVSVIDTDRADAMCQRFKRGHTMQNIASDYGISRERVRQIIKKHAGLTCKDGGYSLGAIERKKIRQEKNSVRLARLEANCIKRHGCTRAQFKMVNAMYSKDSYYKSPIGAFTTQRNSANNRGIEWKFTFWEWWCIWRDSGKWEQRGIGQGKYCMARKGDVGAYEAGNVFISLCVENNSNRPQKKSGLPRGVRKIEKGNYQAFAATAMVKGRMNFIGTFRTPEAASAAYLEFTGQSS